MLNEETCKKHIEGIRRKNLERLRDLENDVKKHKIIEETWMKCKESLLEQNKTLASELNRLSRQSNAPQNARRNKKTSDPGSRPRNSSRSKSVSLDHNKREYSSQMGQPSPTVDTVQDCRDSEVSTK